MPTTAKPSAPPLETPFAVPNTEAVAAITTRQFKTVSHMNETLLKSVTAWHEEVASFVSMRLKKDVQLQSRLSGCHSPSEAIETCSEFMRDALSDYAEATTTLSGLAAKNGIDQLAEISGNGAGQPKKTG